jgi:hypothetical protein
VGRPTARPARHSVVGGRPAPSFKKGHPSMSATSMLTDLVTIDKKRKQLKEELKQLDDARKIVEETILTTWEEEGVTSTKVDGSTVYLSSRRWWTAKNGNRQAVVEALEGLGMDDMVTFNTQTLSSYCNELEKMEEPIPRELLAVVDTSEQFSVKTRG